MGVTRRSFLSGSLAGTTALGIMGLYGRAADQGTMEKTIQGFDDTDTNTDTSREWIQTSERRVRIGIAGYGESRFGAAFSFQDHPNVEVVAVSDLVPSRCANLATECRCTRTYPSLEKMVNDDSIEAIFLATDAPSHARHAMEVLKHGKHVGVAVPAVFGSLEQAGQLLATVKDSGLNYMMFETSTFHNDLYAMRTLFEAGKLGDLVYSEGEYYHYMPVPIPSYKDWRVGLPPMWYPTHATAYYTGVTGGSFTEVSCMGFSSEIPHLRPSGNIYKNPFGTEIALFRLNNDAMARMAISWDTPGASGETGRIRARKGSFFGKYEGEEQNLPDTRKPPLPPGVEAGGHGGSHGYLAHEFIMSIIEKRRPMIDINWALNLTAPGIIAHQSALKNGELMKIPQYI